MKKEPDFLCTWDFCKSCIDYRIKNKLKMPKLRKHKTIQTYDKQKTAR